MMKKFLNLSRKLGFILAIFGAAIIGGASTALVSATIPSGADGQIHGCYRNNGNLLNPVGDLRVVDSDEGQTCTAQETSLNWDSKSNIKTAFAKVNYDQATQTWSLDETKTKNISNFSGHHSK